MDFKELVKNRQSCRKFDTREIEEEKLSLILESARLAPSACNSQPYHITVCKGEACKKVAKALTGGGMNAFVYDAPVILVISEGKYNKTASLGAKIKHNDYRSIDIGILASHITCQACDLGVGSCIIGWFDDKKIREICDLDTPTRLAVVLGYAREDDVLREKKRLDVSEFIKQKD